MNRFSRFIAIDWTGAKGRRHKAIELAECAPGDAPPARIPPPGSAWSRQDVLDFLHGIAAKNEPAIIGFDFSFAPPFLDQGSYFPGTCTPETAPDFWDFVDQNSPDEDLGAAFFVENKFRSYFYLGASCGPKAGFMRLRACERRFNALGGGKPSSIFDCVGAAQVAKASFAGMRLLHQLKGQIPVWPFHPLPDTGPVVVEIYCRAFIRLAGLRGLKVRDSKSLDTALTGLGSRPLQFTGPLSDHLTDVFIASAGLRAIADDPGYWSPPGLTPELARTEGWTFGVR